MELRWQDRADLLSAAAIARGEPTAWFDRLYAAGRDGEVPMPWDRVEPHPLLREWALARNLRGEGRRAVVVGCGLGADAEYLARLGFATTGFDVAPTAVEQARRRNPGSAVDYRVADLLDLPAGWPGAFDLVVEIFTVQTLPDPPRAAAVAAVAGLVAPGGTLFAAEFRRADAEPAAGPDAVPPYPLSRADLAAFAAGGLRTVALEAVDGLRWRAEFHRPRG